MQASERLRFCRGMKAMPEQHTLSGKFSYDEFIRRFLLHVLPREFHRIRHHGLLAGSTKKAAHALARRLLSIAVPPKEPVSDELPDRRPPCSC